MSKPLFVFLAIMAMMFATIFNYSLVGDDNSTSRSYGRGGYIGGGGSGGTGGHK